MKKELPDISVNYDKLEENEPNLGPAWAVLMLILYLLKRAFPAEPYTLLWYFQVYVLGLVFLITLFVIARRHAYFSKQRKERKAAAQPEDKSHV